MSSEITVKCPICGFSNSKLKWNKTNHRIGPSLEANYRCYGIYTNRPRVYGCGNCRSYFTDPGTWPENLTDIYSKVVDVEYIKSESNKKATFTKAIKFVDDYAQHNSTILEIGSYAGFFLDVARDSGYKVVGIEPSHWGSQLAASRGHSVIQLGAESIHTEFANNQFDLVVSWDVLEHIKNPVDLMGKIKNVLKIEGYFICATLDRVSILPILLKGKWPWVIDMHLHYFSKKQMRYMAAITGLEMIRTATYSHYVNLDYALRKLLPNSKIFIKILNQKLVKRIISSINLPINLGDMRVYIFKVLP